MRVEGQERDLILVPAGLEERIIRVLNEGVGAAYQAAMATAAKVILGLYCPGMKCDIKFYVACCKSCDE